MTNPREGAKRYAPEDYDGTEDAPARWRVGRRRSIHVYEQLGAEPSDDDRSVATFHAEADAQRAVDAVNQGAGQPSWIDCPNAEVCKSCPCAGEDDGCFPGERLRADLAAEVAANEDHEREADELRADLADAETALAERCDALRAERDEARQALSHSEQLSKTREGWWEESLGLVKTRAESAESELASLREGLEPILAAREDLITERDDARAETLTVRRQLADCQQALAMKERGTA